jgi:hypothetical protein
MILAAPLSALVRINVLSSVDDYSAELQVAWPLPKPPPAFQGARANAPAACQIQLSEMTHTVGWSVGRVSSSSVEEIIVPRYSKGAPIAPDPTAA